MIVAKSCSGGVHWSSTLWNAIFFSLRKKTLMIRSSKCQKLRILRSSAASAAISLIAAWGGGPSPLPVSPTEFADHHILARFRLMKLKFPATWCLKSCRFVAAQIAVFSLTRLDSTAAGRSVPRSTPQSDTPISHWTSKQNTSPLRPCAASNQVVAQELQRCFPWPTFQLQPSSSGACPVSRCWKTCRFCTLWRC